jgi:hypothetical protein
MPWSVAREEMGQFPALLRRGHSSRWAFSFEEPRSKQLAALPQALGFFT